MQESPNFPSYKSRYQAVNSAAILDGREKITGIDRRFLESVYERLSLYFDDDDFRAQIPLQIRQYNEDNYITNILSYLETLLAWQQDGVTVITGANLQGQISNISGQLTALDQQIIGYYYTYLSSAEPLGKKVQELTALKNAANQESESLNEVLKNVRAQANERKGEFDKSLAEVENQSRESFESQKQQGEKTLTNVESILTKAKLLIGTASGHKLGNYYQKLANGRTIDQNEKFIDDRGKRFERAIDSFDIKRCIAYVCISSVIAYIGIMYVVYNPFILNIWGIVAIAILINALLISGIIYVGINLLRAFNARYKGGHARAAAIWMIGAILATVFTAIYSALLVHNLTLNGKITWEEIIPKIIVLLAPAYLVRLCIQNYRANAHLEVQYMHRATIVSIAESYSESTVLTDTKDREDSELMLAALNAKMGILTEAAKIMFAQSESGYITQKEGAGASNGDNPMDTFRNTVNIK